QRQVGDDHGGASGGGDGVVRLVQQLRPSLGVHVFHGDDDRLRPHCEVHGTTDATTGAAGVGPVGQVPVGAHLVSAQDDGVQPLATGDFEGGDGVEEARPGQHADEVTAGVVVVRIGVLDPHETAVIEDAVLRVQHHVATLEVVDHLVGQPRTEVDDVTVVEQRGSTASDLLARQGRFAVVLPAGVCRTGGTLRQLGNFHLRRRLHHAGDEDAGQVDFLRLQLADLKDFFYLDDGHSGGLGEAVVE